MSTKKSAEERAQARFDKEQSYIDFHNHHGYLCCIREEVEPLESKNASLTEENAKLRALVQGLFNAWHTADGGHDMHKWISAAKKQGFVPSNTTQDNG